MADYNLGTARGIVQIDYDGKGVTQAQAGLAGTGKSASSASQIMGKVGKVAGLAGLGIAAGFGVAAKSAADFEQQMSGIAAVSGASDSQLSALRNKALQLGKDTQFSASESAQAIEELVKAGISVPDVLNGAADAVTNLAAAGGVDMPTAATLAANAMNAFNIKAKDMNGVVDSIAGAANASAIDVGEFGQSLQQVGAVAHLAGAGFDDTATAIALMGNAGIKGSDAGTSLKTMLMRLQPQTEKQAQEMKDLGLMTKNGTNLFYDQQGRLKSLSQVSGLLGKSLKGMTQEQKQAALTTLFGSDAVRGAAVLANEGSKGFDKMAKSMGKVSAADVAAKRMDNLKGSFEQFKGSVETMGIVVGSMLLPALKTIVDALTSAANAFLNLSGGQQKAIAIALGLLGATLLLMAAIIKITQFVTAFKEAMVVLGAAEKLAAVWEKVMAAAQWLLNAAMDANPIGLIIIAIVALVAAIILLWKHSETFRNIVIGVWNAIKGAVMAVVDWFKANLLPFFVGLWNGIKSVFAGIGNAIKTAFVFIVAVIKAYLNIIFGIWKAVWHVFGPIVKAVFGLIVAILKLAWTVIKGVFILAFRLIKSIFVSSWNAMVKTVKTVWNFISNIVRSNINRVKAIMQAVWTVIKNAVSKVWNAILGILVKVWIRIWSVIKGPVERIKGLLSTAWNFIKNALSKAWNAMVKVVADKVGELLAKVTSLKNKITGFFSGAARWLFDAGKHIIQGLIDGIVSMIHKVTDTINGITKKVGNFLPGSPVKEGALRVLNRGHAGKQIVQMLVDGMESMRPVVETTMAGVSTASVPADTGSFARTAASGRQGATGLRLVEGRLHIDPSGRAYIEGVAEEVVLGDKKFSHTMNRMRRAS